MSDNSKYTVMVLEDDEILRDLIVDELKAAGFGVLIATQGKEALSLLRDQPVHAVLSDIMMAGKNGIDVLHEVRAVESVNVPFVFMSGSDDPRHMRKALQLGAVDFLAKPFDMERMVKTLVRVCELGAAERRLQEVFGEVKKHPGAEQLGEEIEKTCYKIRLLRLSHYKNQDK